MLLLSAIKERKDVVLDGTASWAPFVIQTIEMIRKISEYDLDDDEAPVYVRGPGHQQRSIIMSGSLFTHLSLFVFLLTTIMMMMMMMMIMIIN